MKIITSNINSWLIALFVSLTCVASMINSFISIPYISALLSLLILFMSIYVNTVKVSPNKFYVYVILFIILFVSNLLYDAELLSSYFLYYVTFATTSLVLSSTSYDATKILNNLSYIYILYLLIFLFRIQYSLIESDDYGSEQMGLAYSFVPPVLISSAYFIFKPLCDRSRKLTIINILLLVGSLYIILFMTVTRGAILSLLIGLFVLFYFKANKVQRLVISIVSILIIILIFLFLDYFLKIFFDFSENSGIGALTKLAAFADDGDVSNGRNRLYAAAITLFKQHPLLGYGIGYYEQIYKAYVHNIGLQLLCEGGIIGTILFLLPIFRIRFLKNYRDINLGVLHIVLLSYTLILLMFSSTHWLTPTFWLMYFMLMSNGNAINTIS